MCTAIKFNDRFFGRTLDFEHSFGEELIITPRERVRTLMSHNRYAMAGVGVMGGDGPMYFDAINEWGLCSAALNFSHFAAYSHGISDNSVKSSNLITLALGLCRNVREVREMLGRISITADEAYSTEPSGLHWIFADKTDCITVESVKDGLKIYDNPLGVMTNAPEFPYHLTRLADFSSLEAANPESRFTHSPPYSRGMGAIGLPGDFSSSSRFVRATFIKQNLSFESKKPIDMVASLIGTLGCMSVPRGSVLTDDGDAVMTQYTSLMDMDEPSYYLSTATCRTIKRVGLSDRLCTSDKITRLPLYGEEIIINLV